jgi:hypothetical protein
MACIFAGFIGKIDDVFAGPEKIHSAVIPGRRAAASPESIITVRGYGFRTRAFGAIRNDAEN